MESYYGNAEGKLNEIVLQLKEMGATRLEAGYSGGNDEGGVNDLSVYNGSEELGLSGGGWDHPLWHAVNELLATKFGSWAGEFSASGMLHVTVEPPASWTDGVMSSYVTDEEPISVGDVDAARAQVAK
jgi:hypothetical protein